MPKEVLRQKRSCARGGREQGLSSCSSENARLLLFGASVLHHHIISNLSWLVTCPRAELEAWKVNAFTVSVGAVIGVRIVSGIIM